MIKAMAGLIDLDFRQIRKMQDMLKRTPKRLNAVVGKTLNDMAFGTRDQSMAYIDESMIVRNRRFLQTSIVVERARFAEGINRMSATVGSIRRPRHTGWKEQMTGAPMARDKAITTMARGGSRARQVRPSARLKGGHRKFRRPEDYRGKNRRRRAQNMLYALDREGYRKPFVIHGHQNIPSGLWVFHGGRKGHRKLHALQLFAKNVKVKRDPWIHIARARHTSRNPVGRTFTKHAKALFKNHKF